MNEQEEHVCTNECTHETDIDFIKEVKVKTKALAAKVVEVELKVEDIIAHVEKNAHKFAAEELGRLRSLVARL